MPTKPERTQRVGERHVNQHHGKTTANVHRKMLVSKCDELLVTWGGQQYMLHAVRIVHT